MGQQHASPEPFKVLVVEDEFLIAMDLVGLLEEAGYEVMGPVGTVEAALAKLDRFRPHACILDVNLRGKHSAAVAGALKAQKVPFMLSSAYEKANIEQHAAFNDVTNIGKPASPACLLSTLACLLNQ